MLALFPAGGRRRGDKIDMSIEFTVANICVLYGKFEWLFKKNNKFWRLEEILKNTISILKFKLFANSTITTEHSYIRNFISTIESTETELMLQTKMYWIIHSKIYPDIWHIVHLCVCIYMYIYEDNSTGLAPKQNRFARCETFAVWLFQFYYISIKLHYKIAFKPRS